MRHSTTEMIYAREQEALSHALSIILLPRQCQLTLHQPCNHNKISCQGSSSMLMQDR